MMQRTRAIVAATIVVTAAGVAAQETLDVDEAELRAADGSVDWVNFTGVVRQFDTAAQIRGIGETIGASLTDDAGDGAVGRYGLRYTIFRAADPTTAEGLDADILALGAEARVSHIDNVRRILVGYLEAAHGYTRDDARTLAVFATVYNALHRGDLEYLRVAYKPVVTQHVTEQNAGIATHYSEWPGKTRLLIPLRAPGTLSALSTSELADRTVIEELRESTDQGLEVRKDMVDLQERQIDEQQQQIDRDQQTVDQRQQALDEQQRQLEAEREQAERDAAQAQTDEERQAAEQRQRELESQQQALAAQQQQTDTEAAQLAAAQQQVQEQQAAVDEERARIVADEQARDTTDTAQSAVASTAEVFSDKVYFLTTQDTDAEGYYTTQLAVIDPIAGTVVDVADVPHIAERNFTFFGEGLVAVAHRGGATTPTTLVLLDATNLQLQRRGTDAVYRQSHLLLQGQFVYAVVERDDQHTVGKFDPSLELVAESTETVEPRSYLAVFGDELYVSGPSLIHVLNREDLTATGSISR